MRSTTSLTRLLAAGAFAAALVPQTPAFAASSAAEQAQHFIDCARWMLTDPDRHRAECAPGHDVFMPYNNFAQTGLEPPPPPPPPPVVIIPD